VADVHEDAIERETTAARVASGLTPPDVEHAERAAHFAGALFDALHVRLELNAADRQLAVLAAYFHDVGYARDARDHQRKSFDMLRAAQLPSVSDADRDIDALAARYHRKSLPSIEHAVFGYLSTADQRRVRRLSAVVRLAVALDASHLGLVTSVEARADDDSIRLTAHARAEAEVERDRLRENAAAFSHLTQLPIRAEIVTDRRHQSDAE
jgi:exopolyphosphatase/guanosine-5'-triphosphate,3'-diphosphate pyrophosphatase